MQNIGSMERTEDSRSLISDQTKEKADIVKKYIEGEIS